MYKYSINLNQWVRDRLAIIFFVDKKRGEMKFELCHIRKGAPVKTSEGDEFVVI